MGSHNVLFVHALEKVSCQRLNCLHKIFRNCDDPEFSVGNEMFSLFVNLFGNIYNS